MNYYNESDIPNHKEIKIIHLKNNRNKKFYSSTDNIFQFNKGNNLHKIYNNFLINPYIERRKQYQNVNNPFNSFLIAYSKYLNMNYGDHSLAR